MAEAPAAAAGLTLVERYEQLRRVALGGQAEGWRHGLGVLTGRGVAAWIQTWTSHRSPALASVPPKISPLPAGRVLGTATAEVVAVLASMALAHT